MTILARRAANGGWWVLAIALLGVYCGLQSYGERERRAAVAQFFQPHPVAVELTAVEPTDSSLDARTGP